MKTKRALQLAGGTARKLADLFGIKEQSVNKWGDHIPPLREYQLRELRPSWFAATKRITKC